MTSDGEVVGFSVGYGQLTREETHNLHIPCVFSIVFPKNISALFEDEKDCPELLMFRVGKARVTKTCSTQEKSWKITLPLRIGEFPIVNFHVMHATLATSEKLSDFPRSKWIKM